MKALIVDDEEHVRKAIYLLINWEKFGINTIIEAEDGDTAIELIMLEKPDIVFTDMEIPGIHGTELLKLIENHAPFTQTIAISGYDDFDFVHKLVKHGGIDYILKPIDPEQLNKAVEKAVHIVEEEKMKQQQSMQIKQMTSVYLNKILKQVIEEPSYFESLSDTLPNEINLPLKGKSCCIIVVAKDSIEMNKLNEKADKNEILNSIQAICNEPFLREQNGIAFTMNNEEVVIIAWNNLNEVATLLNKINKNIKQKHNVQVEFGIGSIKTIPFGLAQSYQDATNSLQQRNMLVTRPTIHYFDQNNIQRSNVLHLFDFEDSFFFAIRSGQENLIKQTVKNWIDQVSALDQITMEQLELWRQEFNIIKMRWLEKLFDNPSTTPIIQLPFEQNHFITPLNEFGVISLDKWQIKLEEGFLLLAKLWKDSINKEKHTIYEIAEYIGKHFDLNISLQSISNHFHLSREYISRKFKQEFKINLTAYLNNIRIQKSKILLKNPNYNISQIAAMVGFNDEKYFSKVFKRSENVPPNEYRKQHHQEI